MPRTKSKAAAAKRRCVKISELPEWQQELIALVTTGADKNQIKKAIVLRAVKNYLQKHGPTRTNILANKISIATKEIFLFSINPGFLLGTIGGKNSEVLFYHSGEDEYPTTWLPGQSPEL